MPCARGDDRISHINFLRSGYFLAFEKALRFLVNIFVFAYSAKVMTTGDFGTYVYFMVVVAFSTVVSTAGLNELSVKLFMEEQQKGVTTSLSGIIVIRLVLGSVCAAFVFAFLGPQFFYFALALVAGSFNSSTTFLESCGKGFSILVNAAIWLLVFAICKLYVAGSENPVEGLGMVFLMETLVLSAWPVFYCCLRAQFRRVAVADLFGLIKQSKPLWLASVISVSSNRLDVFLASYMLNEYMLAQYLFAIRLLDYVLLVPATLSNSLMPAFVNNWSELYEENAYFITFLSGLLFLFIVIGVSIWLLPFLYGNKYEEAQSILCIVAFGLPFVGLRVISGKFCIIRGLQKYLSLRAFFGLCLAALAFPIGGYLYGVTGMAIAFVIVSIGVGLVFDYLFVDMERVAFTKRRGLERVFRMRASGKITL